MSVVRAIVALFILSFSLHSKAIEFGPEFDICSDGTVTIQAGIDNIYEDGERVWDLKLNNYFNQDVWLYIAVEGGTSTNFKIPVGRPAYYRNVFSFKTESIFVEWTDIRLGSQDGPALSGCIAGSRNVKGAATTSSDSQQGGNQEQESEDEESTPVRDPNQYGFWIRESRSGERWKDPVVGGVATPGRSLNEAEQRNPAGIVLSNSVEMWTETPVQVYFEIESRGIDVLLETNDGQRVTCSAADSTHFTNKGVETSLCKIEFTTSTRLSLTTILNQALTTVLDSAAQISHRVRVKVYPVDARPIDYINLPHVQWSLYTTTSTFKQLTASATVEFRPGDACVYGGEKPFVSLGYAWPQFTCEGDDKITTIVDVTAATGYREELNNFLYTISPAPRTVNGGGASNGIRSVSDGVSTFQLSTKVPVISFEATQGVSHEVTIFVFSGHYDENRGTDNSDTIRLVVNRASRLPTNGQATDVVLYGEVNNYLVEATSTSSADQGQGETGNASTDDGSEGTPETREGYLGQLIRTASASFSPVQGACELSGNEVINCTGDGVLVDFEVPRTIFNRVKQVYWVKRSREIVRIDGRKARFDFEATQGVDTVELWILHDDGSSAVYRINVNTDKSSQLDTGAGNDDSTSSNDDAVSGQDPSGDDSKTTDDVSVDEQEDDDSDQLVGPAFAAQYLQTNSNSKNVTSIHIINSSDEAQSFTGSLYNGSGSRLGSANQSIGPTVPPKGRLVLSSSDIERMFGVSPWAGPAMLKVFGSGNFALMSKLVSPSGLVSNTNCVTDSRYLLNIEGFNSKSDTFVRVINVSDQVLDARIGLWDQGGYILGSYTDALKGLQPNSQIWLSRSDISRLVGTEWNGAALLDVIPYVDGQPVKSGLKLINLNLVNRETFFNFTCSEYAADGTGWVNLQTTSTSRAVSYTQIVNESRQAFFYGTLYDGDGDVLGQENQRLSPSVVRTYGRLVLSSKDLEEIFDVSPWTGPALLKVTNNGSGPFHLMTKLVSPSGLISSTNCSSEDFAANVEGYDSPNTSFVRLINRGSRLQNVTGTLYDQNGAVIGTPNKVIAPTLESNAATWLRRDDLANFFGATWNGVALLEITSKAPELKLVNLNLLNNETFFNFSCYERAAVVP